MIHILVVNTVSQYSQQGMKDRNIRSKAKWDCEPTHHYRTTFTFSPRRTCRLEL